MVALLARLIYFLVHLQLGSSNLTFPDTDKGLVTMTGTVVFSLEFTYNYNAYATHYAATIRALDACSVSISKKIHEGRGNGAQNAEIDGATEYQLHRHGR
ncbi:hypothetical protein CU097_011130 [Rhizopus azygosporus]|uniref:Uncharacterized protein n=2 Tax=Rhizopus TaxID=4842 RepID=A0A367JED2_RHIAZ|nr:hypothetical protein BCV71DRAFT_265155 [Rhizopus microsporus]RCH88267.1 hypothetical protein CU097_011130 [Rhizopus azygosporus]